MPRISLWRLAIGATIVCVIWSTTDGLSQAIEIKVLSTSGARGAMIELARRFEAATDHSVTLEFESSALLAQRIYGDEPFEAVHR